LAEARPVAFLLEDVHWIDPTTLELLELTIDAVAAAPVLMVLTSRPDNQPALAAHPHVTRLALNRLGRAGVDAIVERLGGAALPRDTVEAIIARTDGVPLFVEELTKAVVESGDTAVPASLHDSLMARLDRTPEVKEIAQCAACIGREFDLALLRAATERDEGELRAGLDRLAAAELVFRRGVGESERYVFKHALVRDAAYESLLLSRRRSVHAHLADALERTAPPEVVARHAEAAGEIDRAVAQYRLAGESAVARPAYHEAAAHFGAALRLIEERGGGPEALSAATRRGVALIGAEGYAAGQTVAAFVHARELLDRIGDAPEWPAVRYGGWVGNYVGADLPEAERLAREVLADCRDADPHAFLGVANRMLATTLTMAGRFRESLPHLEESVAFYDPMRDADHGRRYGTDSGASAHAYSAIARWVLGDVEASRDHLRKALEIAARPGHPALSLAYTTGHAAILGVTAGDADAIDVANRVIDQSVRDGIEIWRVFGLIASCAARAAADDPDGALADAEAGRTGLRGAGSRLFLGVLLRAEARAHIALGAREAAARSIAEMEAVMAATDQRWDEADLRCVDAELALAHDDAETAEARYRAAIDLARAQTALSWERRAAIPLARLAAARGAAAEARDVLVAVQRAFVDRSETPDHRAAAALLAELERS
jgi:tetratricopeptide (TPR) repeat protein